MTLRSRAVLLPLCCFLSIHAACASDDAAEAPASGAPAASAGAGAAAGGAATGGASAATGGASAATGGASGSPSGASGAATGGKAASGGASAGGSAGSGVAGTSGAGAAGKAGASGAMGGSGGAGATPECASQADCTDAGKPFCDTKNGKCVTPALEASCGEAQFNQQCAKLCGQCDMSPLGGKVCDVGTGTCLPVKMDQQKRVQCEPCGEFDGPCEFGLTCVLGVCMAVCCEHSDCGPGAFCVDEGSGLDTKVCVKKPCEADSECPGDRPFCDDLACHECRQSSDCKSAGARACDAGSCVACLVNSDCTDDPTRGVCVQVDPECPECGHECVTCAEDTDCKDPNKPRCLGNTCYECKVNSDCKDPAKPTCWYDSSCHVPCTDAACKELGFTACGADGLCK